MSYRVRYCAYVDWVGPGLGPLISAQPAIGVAPGGNAQTLGFFNTPGGQNANTFTAGDITALTNAVAADLAAQFNLQIGRVQGFATGGT
jgi:hypothetical protein